MKICRSLLVLMLVTASLWGCDATTRYRTLRFFFDGVPNPEEEKAARSKDAGAGDSSRKAAAPSFREHAPYAEKKCDGCHVRQSNVLVAPIEALCFKCHEFKMEKKWVHGPLASGGCLVCHDPHRSRYPFLLVSKSENFCLHCHEEKAVAANEVHRGGAKDCTACHDAHMSDNRFLLK